MVYRKDGRIPRFQRYRSTAQLGIFRLFWGNYTMAAVQCARNWHGAVEVGYNCYFRDIFQATTHHVNVETFYTGYQIMARGDVCRPFWSNWCWGYFRCYPHQGRVGKWNNPASCSPAKAWRAQLRDCHCYLADYDVLGDFIYHCARIFDCCLHPRKAYQYLDHHNVLHSSQR
ncbi:hypothetical protein EMPG_16005 [Blastomyces silverae]|uniref:Uncharacterized protein n=1 Tax=Blastomyces silverae TaxID=2060906 RepID=A0A0H1BC22_9EURO|nr:hypothetical protein EMPG_16005 [Blastomyces silverae]